MSEVLEKPVVKKQAIILTEPRMASAEQWRQDWVVNAEEGTTVDNVMDPMYWSHVSQKFEQYDHVEVRQETGEWILELTVISSGRNWARMHLRAKHELADATVDTPRELLKYEVLHKGPQKKFCVIRLADKALIQEGFSDKRAADEWLRNHERVTG